MPKQVSKSFTTLVVGFLIGISAAELYHMEKQPALDEACSEVSKARGFLTPAIAAEKFSVVEIPATWALAVRY